jgi:hypothetical protein
MARFGGGFGPQYEDRRRWDPASLSYRLYTYDGIRVRVHLVLVLYLLFTLLDGLGPFFWRHLWVDIVLFGSVLLHEYGHCYGSRWQGGRAEDILMWCRT